MTPPSRPAAPPAAPDLADAAEHASAEAVAWSGERAIVVGSAGTAETAAGSEAPPGSGNALWTDPARYHGWLRAVDGHGSVAWTRRIDRGREVHVRAVAPFGPDLVIAGEQRAGDARAYTGWLARIASDGAERWWIELPGAPGATSLQALAVRGDGSVVAGGYRRGKAWLVAVDAHGTVVRDDELPGLDEVTAMTAIGDLVVVAGIAGRTTSRAGTSRVIALAASGEVRWSLALPERGPGELSAVAALGAGGVAVGQAPGEGGRDGAWIVRFGAGGELGSSQVLPATVTDAAHAVAATSDGGFVVAGTRFDAVHGRRGSLWRFDSAGALVWQRAYAGDSFARGVAAMPDGGAVAVGATGAPGAKLRPWILAVDRLGAARWTAP